MVGLREAIPISPPYLLMIERLHITNRQIWTFQSEKTRVNNLATHRHRSLRGS